MFSAEQIQGAHSKVRSGADFPAYIQDIKKLGVTYYKSFVDDGHTDYYGKDDYKVSIPPKYEPLKIASECYKEQFKADLKDHQLGKTNYLEFIKISTDLGIATWEVCMEEMTCTYYDKTGNEVWKEVIPQ